MPQEIATDVFFTPRESLEVQAGLYGVPERERRTDHLLAAMGLTDKANAYVRQLSGGMKRRLMVAKAMVHNPPVLVLDEPTAGVDVELRRQLWAYVEELNAQGRDRGAHHPLPRGGGGGLRHHRHHQPRRGGGLRAQGSCCARLDSRTLVVTPATPLARRRTSRRSRRACASPATWR